MKYVGAMLLLLCGGISLALGVQIAEREVMASVLLGLLAGVAIGLGILTVQQ